VMSEYPEWLKIRFHIPNKELLKNFRKFLKLIHKLEKKNVLGKSDSR
jgi:hypothetical protein